MHWSIQMATLDEEQLGSVKGLKGRDLERLLEKKEYCARKDKFRNFLSAMASLPQLSQLTILGNSLEEQPSFRYWLRARGRPKDDKDGSEGDTLKSINMKEFVGSARSRHTCPTDDIWSEDIYHIIPGPRFRFLRQEEQRKAKLAKEVEAYRKEVEADLFAAKRGPVKESKEPPAPVSAEEEGADAADKKDDKAAEEEVVVDEEAVIPQFCQYKISDLTLLLTRLDVERSKPTGTRYLTKIEEVSTVNPNPNLTVARLTPTPTPTTVCRLYQASSSTPRSPGSSCEGTPGKKT